MKPSLAMLAYMAYWESDYPPSESEWRDNPNRPEWERVAQALSNVLVPAKNSQLAELGLADVYTIERSHIPSGSG